MTRMNINILEISELTWIRMGKFNSDEHYVYYCGQKSLRWDRVALIWLWVQNPIQFSSVQLLSHSWLFATPWTAGHQASLSITNSQNFLNSCPSSQWHHPTTSCAVIPISSIQSFPNQGLFQLVICSRQMAKVLEFQLQRQSFQWIFRTDFLYDRLVGSLCSPRDSKESSPTLQFKTINSLGLSFL